jgi:signal transduction histidine kinase
MSIDFLHTYRSTSREVRHLPVTEANASWWTVDAQRDTFHGQLSMSISCLLIIFFGFFSVIFTALLPHAIWPYTVLLCIGIAVFVYIFYSLDNYGTFIEAATCATEDIIKGHTANKTIFHSKGLLLCTLTFLTFAIFCQHVSGEAPKNTVTDRQDTCRVAHEQVQEDCHLAQLDSIEQELALKKLQLQNEQLQQRSRFTMGSLVMIMGIIALLVFLVYSSRWSRQLEIKNQQLQRERNVVVAQNKQLAVERDRAEAASRAKTAFIQSMTHEIRTPLNHISGFSQVLAMPGIDLSEKERIDYSQHIQEGTLHLTNILDDLIQISDLESHSELPSTEECYPNLMAAQITDSIRMMLNDGVEISVQSLVADDFVVNTYPNLLQTALKKLLDNAVKFTQKGSITLTTELNGQELHFSVQDTGPGIPIEKHDYIFERFSKLDSFMQGTGLGLPIARMIAERLNGTLTLDTNYTNGAKFDLIIKI